MTTYRVVAVGDSVMWGQGVDRPDTFVYLTANELARHFGHSDRGVWMEARSGAHLTTPLDSDSLGRFAETFPEIFPDDRSRDKFLNDEQEWAKALGPEIPGTYPTVNYQIDFFRADIAAAADLLLLNGGGNDVNFAAILDPNGPSIAKASQSIQLFLQYGLLATLKRARAKFPNAIIVVPAYYAPFSDSTDPTKLADAVKDLQGLSAWFLVLKYRKLLSAAGFIPGLGVFASAVAGLFEVLAWFSNEELSDALPRIIARSQFAFARALFFQSAAVSAAMRDPSTRGPGIILVHPRFRPDNAMFAGGLSVLWEDYNAPTSDPMREERLRLDPRMSIHDQINRLAASIRSAFVGWSEAIRTGEIDWTNLPENGSNVQSEGWFRSELDQLRRVARGPLPLVRAMDRVHAVVNAERQPSLRSKEQREELLNGLVELEGALASELLRLHECRIASFLHPNKEGAARYATAIEAAVKQHVTPDLARLIGMLRPHVTVRRRQPPTDDDVLRAFGLNPADAPSDLVQFMTLDSIALRIATVASIKVRSVTLVTSSHTWRLQNPEATRIEVLDFVTDPSYSPILEDFEPNHVSLFTMDAWGGMDLEELASAELELDGDMWEAGDITLFANGREVFRGRGRRMTHGERFALGYPRVLLP